MGIIVLRPRLGRFLSTEGRRLLYGRRKTGKTFYARYVLSGYKYLLVRRGGGIYDPVEDYEMDLRGFLRECGAWRGFILDEFHRADPRLMDAVQAGECGDNFVFLTSTLHYYRRFVEGPEAPLKGLFRSMQLGLLSPLELLATEELISKFDDPMELIEHLIFYQEPAVIGWSLEDVVRGGWDYSKSLVGEVLGEEDVAYTKRMDAVVEAIAAGRARLSEMTSYMYARGLIDKQSTGMLTKYLGMSIRFGMVERLEIWGRRRGGIYRHVSPLTWTAYYLQTRYGFYDLHPNIEFGLKVLKQLTPLLVEQFVERYFSELYGLKPAKIVNPEIDIALLEYRKPRLVGEVKWKPRVTRSEVRRAEEKLHSIKAEHRILFTPKKEAVPETDLEVWDVSDLISKAKTWLSSIKNPRGKSRGGSLG